MKKFASLIAVSAASAGSVFAGVSATPNAQGLYEITNPISSDTVLESSKPYLLKEIVYVGNPGNTGVAASSAKLTIPAGTTIYGRIGVKSGTSIVQAPGTLVVTRAGQIEATGSPSQPIIFTYEGDANPRTAPTAPFSSDLLVTGLWGGVILLGNAPTNNNESGSNSLLSAGTDFIEGLVQPTPGLPTPGTEDLRGIYGGFDPHDSSGVLRYVSIRNGGFNLSANNEINGLTLGGVGDGTTIEFIEVIAGQDDGFEFFGGTVNTKYLLSAYNNDDAFDYDQGFTGLGQFWAAIMPGNETANGAVAGDGDKGGEFDGDDQDSALPAAAPVIYNMTVIGGGEDGKTGEGKLTYTADAGGSLFNSIIAEVKGAVLECTETRFNTGLLNIRSNIWYSRFKVANFEGNGLVSTNTAAVTGADAEADTILAAVSANNTFTAHTLGGANGANLVNLKRYQANGVPLKPSAASQVITGLEPYIGSFFTAVSYKGAFDPNSTAWTNGWTVPSQLGYFIE